jgi:hypothetical protein
MRREVRLFDALDEFAKGAQLTHALALTYGYDGDVAYERVWKPLIERYGVPHPLVIADGVVRGSGTTARVNAGTALGVHVVRASRARASVFHPKLFLAVRDEAVFLAVGSANLTSGGLGSNLELMTALRFARGEVPSVPRTVLDGALDFLRGLVRPAIVDRVHESSLNVFDETVRHAQLIGEDVPLEGQTPLAFVSSATTPIWDQLLEIHGDDPLEHMLVVSPFWGMEDPDGDGEAMIARALGDRTPWSGKPALEMCVGTLEAAMSRVPLETIKKYANAITLRTQSLQAEDVRRLHGKLIVLQGSSRTTVYWGSANFTPSALLKTWEGGGNAECGLLLRRPRAELTLEAVEHAFGLREVFVPYRGPLPELSPVKLEPPELFFEVGELVYDPATGELALFGERYDERVRVLRVRAEGIDGFEATLRADGALLKGTWPGRALEETDPETGLKRLRTMDFVVTAFDEDGSVLDETRVRVNVRFDHALEVRQNVLLGANALSADALLVPTTAPPEHRVAVIDGYLQRLRELRREGGVRSAKHQASLDVFYRNVRRGLDTRFAMLERMKGARFAMLRWGADLRRALDKATADALDGPRRSFIVLRTSEHVSKVLTALPTWQPDWLSSARAVDGPALARSLAAIPLDPGLRSETTEIERLRADAVRRLEELR